MTVYELIKELQTMPLDSKAVVEDPENSVRDRFESLNESLGSPQMVRTTEYMI